MYYPHPLDTTDVRLPESLNELMEQLARNVHEVWAAGRIAEGWRWGEVRDDEHKLHPCLVSYDELPEIDTNEVTLDGGANAVEDFTKFLQIANPNNVKDPQFYSTYSLRGNCYKALGDLEKARADYMMAN